MNTARVYYDSDDNECTIWQMVEREPEWAASRLQHYEKVEAEHADMLAMLNELEWGGNVLGVDYCPDCTSMKDSGHTASCTLGNLLKQIKGDK